MWPTLKTPDMCVCNYISKCVYIYAYTYICICVCTYIYVCMNVDQEIVAVAACKNAPAPLCAPLGAGHSAEPPPNPPAA